MLSTPRRLLGAALLSLLVFAGCSAPLPGESWANISTDGHYIYVAYKENIFRVNPQAIGPSGQQRRIEWLQSAPANAHMYGAPAISDDKKLYVGAYDKRLYEFTQSSLPTAPLALGTAATDKFVGGVLLNGDVIYAGVGDKGVMAVDRKQNKDVWTFSGTTAGVWSTPVLADGTLYVTSLDHFLYALNPATGDLKWKTDLGGATAGTPLYDNGIIYVGTFSNELVSVDTAQQKVSNRFKTEGWVWGVPTLWKEGDTTALFFGDLSGWVYSIDPHSFQLKWKKTDTEHTGAIRGSIAVAKVGDKTIAIAGSESKYVLAYDAKSGDKVWASSIIATDKILSNPILLGDDVIFTTLNDDQLVVAFKVADGVLDWWVSIKEQLPIVQTATAVPVSTDAATSAATAAATAASTDTSTQAATDAATAAPTAQ